MELTEEEENLLRARKVIDDDLQPKLRDFFKKSWNAIKGMNQLAWSDCSTDGQALWAERKTKPKTQGKTKQFQLDKESTRLLKSGDTNTWDATCLFEAILIVADGTEKKSICALRHQRNLVFHRYKGILSKDEKEKFFLDLKGEYRKLKWPTDIVERIETASISTEEIKKLKAQLQKDRKKGKLLIDRFVKERRD